MSRKLRVKSVLLFSLFLFNPFILASQCFPSDYYKEMCKQFFENNFSGVDSFVAQKISVYAQQRVNELIKKVPCKTINFWSTQINTPPYLIYLKKVCFPFHLYVCFIQEAVIRTLAELYTQGDLQRLCILCEEKWLDPGIRYSMQIEEERAFHCAVIEYLSMYLEK